MLFRKKNFLTKKLFSLKKFPHKKISSQKNYFQKKFFFKKLLQKKLFLRNYFPKKIFFTKKIFSQKNCFHKEIFSRETTFSEEHLNLVFQKNISICKNCSDVRYNKQWMIFIQRKGERTYERTHERTHKRTNERTSLIFRYTLLSVEGVNCFGLDSNQVRVTYVPEPLSYIPIILVLFCLTWLSYFSN